MDEISITNPNLTYVSVYDTDTGERITSYVTGVHGDTVDELEALATHAYPDETHVTQDAVTYTTALQGDLLYKAGAYTERPEPTDEEKRAAELQALDAEYATKIGNIETEMAKAKAIEDDDYYADLKAEREELVAEYEEKRGAI